MKQCPNCKAFIRWSNKTLKYECLCNIHITHKCFIDNGIEQPFIDGKSNLTNEEMIEAMEVARDYMIPKYKRNG